MPRMPSTIVEAGLLATTSTFVRTGQTMWRVTCKACGELCTTNSPEAAQETHERHEQGDHTSDDLNQALGLGRYWSMLKTDKGCTDMGPQRGPICGKPREGDRAFCPEHRAMREELSAEHKAFWARFWAENQGVRVAGPEWKAAAEEWSSMQAAYVAAVNAGDQRAADEAAWESRTQRANV